jgi:hypothetical protein
MNEHEPAANGGLGMVDTWARFAQHEIPAEIERLRKKPMSVEQLQAELHSTVLHAVGQIAHMLVSMRDDAYERIGDLEAQVEELTEQVQDIDTPSPETQLLPEDAQAIGKLAAAAKLFAEESLKSTGDLAAIAKLNEVIGIAEYCDLLSKEKIIEELPVEEGDDGEQGDQSAPTDDVESPLVAAVQP